MPVPRMMRALSWLLSAALILSMMAAVPQPVLARIHGGIAAGGGGGGGGGACPQATDNGCGAAAANGSFKNASLLTSAQQSGQTSLLPTRAGGSLTLNIPGVDYGIGPDSTLTPQDPRTINDGVCIYEAAVGPAPWVYCAGTGTINETLNNYDFCGSKIGKTTVLLYVGGRGGANTPTLGSTFTVTNSYFCLAPGLNMVSWGGGNGPNWNIKFWNNQCDGSTADATAGFCLNGDVDASGTSVDVRYNAFINQGLSRVAGGMTFGTWTFRYNFVQGLNDLATSSHGEIMLRNCGGVSRSPCTTSDDYEGNFIVWNPPPASGLNNATVFPGDGSSDAVSLTSFTMKDNIIVTNKTGSTTVINQALFNSRLATLGTVTMTGNWVDATGADDCSISGVKAAGPQVTASQSGTVITITGFGNPTNWGNNPIEPKWQFWRGGVLVATILSMGTSGGNTGTVNVDTSAIIGSDSLWTLVPGFNASPTLAPNWNLAGSGAPVAMGLNGPQFTATHCSPGY